jgi:hypothetical protein
MPHADPVDVEGLRDDGVVGPALRDAPLLGQVGDSREAPALLVDRPADLDRAGQNGPGPPERLAGMDRGRDARLHVAGPAAPDLAVADGAAERVHRPAGAGRHDVDVAVQVYDRTRAAPPPRPHHVHPRVRGRVLWPALGGVVLHLEAAAAEARAQQASAVRVELPGRIHRGDADQLGGEFHHLVGEGVDFPQHATAQIGHPGQVTTTRRGAAEPMEVQSRR